MVNSLLKILVPYRSVKYSSLQEEQKICVEFANEMRKRTLEGRLPYVWFHIANEFLPSVRINYLFDLKQKHMGKISGLPDYCFIGAGGKSFFIEFKTLAGKLSQNQKIFSEWCASNKIDYFICRTVRDAIEVVNARIKEHFLKFVD